MIDSPKMISIGISVSKKLEGPKLKKEDIQFLIQEAKQQILKIIEIKILFILLLIIIKLIILIILIYPMK